MEGLIPRHEKRLIGVMDIVERAAIAFGQLVDRAGVVDRYLTRPCLQPLSRVLVRGYRSRAY